MHGTKSFWKSSKFPELTLALFTLGWVIVLSGAAWRKLYALGMGFDLGMYEQVIWNTAQGRPFVTSAFAYTTNHIGADLILLEAVLAPLYALVPETITLLVAQVLAVASGVWPLYLLARDQLHSEWAGVSMGVAYLLYPPLLYLTLNEFQPRAFALTSILFALYALAKAWFGRYLLFLFLSLLTRSDVALVVIMFGVLAWLWRKPLKFVWGSLLLGGIWFIGAVFFIVPAFKTGSGGFVFFETYGWLGRTPTEILMTFLTRPLQVAATVFSPPKIQFLIQVVGPTLPFSLLRPEVWLLALPTLALNLLSQYNVQANITRQYAALLYPVVYAATVLGLAWLAKLKWFVARVPYAILVPSAVTLVLMLTFAESLFVGNPVVAAYRKPLSPRVETLTTLLQMVPPTARLGVSNHVGPFAGRRQGFYFFPPHTFYTDNTFEVSDYILIDVRADGAGQAVQAGLERLKRESAWELIAERDGYVLYRKR